ncbi:RNA pol II transcription cofactor [Didymosphaeria variabile]|uniref:RNA pol II transcription cofactor n=1 Tax=Didymosphaeria variabile TaxID=1932322 RepID=A0A9W9CFM1_9PLEO|nr:RNA pol II transcription cofactor [Didymosphaeria variabile]KAJ4359615.1 RNA pol II transcription cofactor [Didymosphaeria variabile]
MLDHASVSPDSSGFPDHPHRGQETISYILSGKLKHEDFAGNSGILTAGSLQFMTAGRGIMHSEMSLPADDGTASEGLQLWVDLPKEKKMCEPRYRDLTSSEIQEVSADAGRVKVRVISGVSNGVQSRQDLTYTPIWYLDFTVKPGGTVKQLLPQGWNAFAYVMAGEVLISGSQHAVKQFDLVTLEEDGDGFEASVLAHYGTEARFILVAGQPLDQPVVQHGPFVMTSRAEIVQAVSDFRMRENGFERAATWTSRAMKGR